MQNHVGNISPLIQNIKKGWKLHKCGEVYRISLKDTQETDNRDFSGEKSKSKEGSFHFLKKLVVQFAFLKIKQCTCINYVKKIQKEAQYY